MEATPVGPQKHARCLDRWWRRAGKCCRRRRAGWDLGARAPLCLAPLWQASARMRRKIAKNTILPTQTDPEKNPQNLGCDFSGKHFFFQGFSRFEGSRSQNFLARRCKSAVYLPSRHLRARNTSPDYLISREISGNAKSPTHPFFRKNFRKFAPTPS